MAVESNRARRAHWVATVERIPHVDDDTEFWLRIPDDQRARVTWELSAELFALANRNGGAFDEETGERFENGDSSERRLPRAAFRVTRR